MTWGRGKPACKEITERYDFDVLISLQIAKLKTSIMPEDLDRERLNLEKELEREKIKIEREKLNLEREVIQKQSISQRNVAIISLISAVFGAIAAGTIEGVMNIALEDKKRESQIRSNYHRRQSC